MAALGDKIAANILAQTASVPSSPWSGDGLTCQLTEEGTLPDAGCLGPFGADGFRLQTLYHHM